MILFIRYEDYSARPRLQIQTSMLSAQGLNRRVSNVDIGLFISKEIDSSNNIKSKETRKNVKSGLKNIESYLKCIKKFPQNGLVIFVGFTIQEGFKSEYIISPIPLTKKIYICGKKWETDILRNELDNSQGTNIYIIIDGNECNLFTCCGYVKKLIWKKSVNLDGDTSRGGQSQARHSRNRDIQKKNYVTICFENIKNYISKLSNINFIFIAGKSNFKKRINKNGLWCI